MLSNNSGVKKNIYKIFFGLILISIIRNIYYKLVRKYKKYPPGPIGLPLFGSFFSCNDISKYSSYLYKTYGDITMINIGVMRFVFLHNIEYINEVLSNKHAIYRSWDNSLILPSIKTYELPVSLANDLWLRKRKIFQSIMVSQLNTTYINNIFNKIFTKYIFKSLNKCIKENKLWYPINDINYIQIMFLWNAVYGTYLPYENKIWKEFAQMVHKLSDDAGFDMLLKFFKLNNILPQFILNQLGKTSKRFMQLIEKQIYVQINDLDETVFDFKNKNIQKKWDKYFANESNLNCMITKMIAFHRNNPDIDSSKDSILLEILSAFVGGMDIMIVTAEYGMVLLSKYEKEQELIYNELYNIFKNDILMETIELKNVINKIHYLRAFVYEVLRLSSASLFGVGHINLYNNIKLKNNKYIIPKNSFILADIPNANRYDKYWLKKTNNNTIANKLCLNAWLDKNNNFKLNLNKNKMLTFGCGPRKCAGQHLALKSLYLMFAKFILNYKFYLNKKDKNCKINQKATLVLVMEPKIGIMLKKR